MLVAQPNSTLPFQFPVDLTRDIFEISARESARTAQQLVLVSRIVRTWIETVLYESVTLVSRAHADKFISSFEHRPPSFFKNIKSLVLEYRVGWTRAARVLELCTDVEDLSCCVPFPLSLPNIAQMTPRRLKLNVTTSGFDAPDNATRTPDFTLPLFANATHLLFVDTQSWDHWQGIEALQNATHLGLHLCAILPERLALISHILDVCPNLKLVWLRVYEECDTMSGLTLFDDPRVVMEKVPPKTAGGSWDDRWRGKEDFWAQAEMVVQVQTQHRLTSRQWSVDGCTSYANVLQT
ncbi:hypothetical protein HGRIS_008774 [Hohenbuehelia grisea]|uniref:F-box domain-containing protein n=1 Tax=Hohenbuehelia grisea TaxID=104357 RepID=A0ABR3J8Z0_9AGAR